MPPKSEPRRSLRQAALEADAVKAAEAAAAAASQKAKRQKVQEAAPTDPHSIFLQLAVVVKKILCDAKVKDLRAAIEKYHTRQDLMKEFLYLFEVHLNYVWYQQQSSRGADFKVTTPTESFILDNFKIPHDIMSVQKLGAQYIYYESAPDKEEKELCRIVSDPYIQDYKTVFPSYETEVERKVQNKIKKVKVTKHDHRYLVISSSVPTYVPTFEYIKTYRFTAKSAMLPQAASTLNTRMVVSRVMSQMFDLYPDTIPLQRKYEDPLPVVPLVYAHDKSPENSCVCYLCGKPITAATNALDHVIPVAVAFILGVIDSPLNYAPTHGTCNGTKQATLPIYDVKNASGAEAIYGAFARTKIIETMADPSNMALFAGLRMLLDAKDALNKGGHYPEHLDEAIQNVVSLLPYRITVGGATSMRHGLSRASASAARQVLRQVHNSLASARDLARPPARSLALAPARSLASARAPARSLAPAIVPTSARAPSARVRASIQNKSSSPSRLAGPKHSLSYFNNVLSELRKLPVNSIADIHKVMLYETVRDFFNAIVQINDATKPSQSRRMTGGAPYQTSLSSFLDIYARGDDDAWPKSDRIQFVTFRLHSLYLFSRKYWRISMDEEIVPRKSYEEFIDDRIIGVLDYINSGGSVDGSLQK